MPVLVAVSHATWGREERVRSDSGRSVNLVIFWFLVFGFCQNGRWRSAVAPWSRGPRRGTRRERHRRSAVWTTWGRCEVRAGSKWTLDAPDVRRRRRFRPGAPQPQISIRGGLGGKKLLCSVCRGDGGGRPETGRRGAYLVRELVGVTLVDRLGGEEEGGTVLGSHRSCVMMREGAG